MDLTAKLLKRTNDSARKFVGSVPSLLDILSLSQSADGVEHYNQVKEKERDRK